MASTTIPRARPRLSRSARRSIEGYLLISPWLIGFLALTLGPLLASMFYSFTYYNIGEAFRWTGLDNYKSLIFEDPLFWTSLYNTVYYTLLAVPSTLIVALGFALLLNQKVWGMPFFRTAYYLPSVTPAVANAVLWMWIFNPQFGLLNYGLQAVGLPRVLWLADPMWSKPSLVIMHLWSLGGPMVIYLAGLQGIPAELHEAAMIDGAGRWARFRHVTIPIISPVIFFNLIMQTIASFQVFVAAYIMTAGGPLDSTRFYVLYLFNRAFGYFQMGYASAMAWILFLVILLVTILNFKVLGGRVYYETGGR
jgi:multiple sugar transport system permease protein